MPRILVVFETAWDRRQIAAAGLGGEGGHDYVFAAPADADTPYDLDIVGWIERTVAEHRGAVDGVFSSSDYPGATVAGAIATALGTPGTPPERMLRVAHKYYARIVQQASAPEVTPPFALVDPRLSEITDPAIGYPCFVKPVKGAFSVLARRIDDGAQLREFLRSPPVEPFLCEWMAIFEKLVARYTDFEHGGRRFLAEGLLAGEQVTLEGYCRGEEVHRIGVVDSGFHAGTSSFSRFDYPSALPSAVQERMWAAVERVVRGAGLCDLCFNAETVWDRATDEIGLLELNPRIAGQFGDLYQKVDGVNAYEIASALATGAPPPAPRGGTSAVAVSFPLRVFRPTLVRRVPTADDVRAAEALFPGTQVWLECAAGEVLADFASYEDGQSHRYAVVNLGADSREDASRRLEAVVARLGLELEPQG